MVDSASKNADLTESVSDPQSNDPNSNRDLRETFENLISVLHICLKHEAIVKKAAVMAGAKQFNVNPNAVLPTNQEGKQWGIIGDSMSHLCNRKHEIVAVIPSLTAEQWARIERAKKWNVEEKLLNLKTLGFHIAANPRRLVRNKDDPRDALYLQSPDAVTIFTAQEPTSLDPSNPMPYTRANWPSTKNFFQNHLGCISKILNDPSPSNRQHLFTYAVPNNAPKMLRRVGDTIQFYNALTKASASNMDYSPPFPLPAARHTVPALRDGKLLESIATMDFDFLSLSIEQFPHLRRISKDYHDSDDREDVPQIYTRMTGPEIHNLLVQMLKVFYESLQALNSFTETPCNEGIKTFDRAAYRLVGSALILQGLAYSSFIDDHIRRLGLCDPEPVGSDTQRAPDNTNENDDDDDEVNNLLQGPKRCDAPGTPSSSHGRWLRRICLTVESVDNILGAVSVFSSPIRVEIKVVAATLPPTRIITNSEWMNVVRDAMDAPGTVTDLPSTSNPLSNSSITFPTTSASPNKTDAFPSTSAALPTTLPSTPTTPSRCTHQDAINIIDRVIRSLKQKFFFSGSIHCEATLAALMLIGRIPVSDIIGVSKRSCPTCVELLTSLHQIQKFYVTGAHPNFTPCSLPPFIPRPVIQEMVQKFRTFLKATIERLHLLGPPPDPAPSHSTPSTPTDPPNGQRQIPRGRTESLDSQALSITSNDGSHDGLHWIVALTKGLAGKS